MENTSLKQSYTNMKQLIKKSNDTLFKAFVLILIPVLIINCYTFYAVYGGSGLNYSSIEQLDIDAVMSGSTDAMTEFQDALYNVFPDVSYEQTLSDFILDILNSLLIMLLDAFVIILLSGIIFDKKYSNSDALKQAIKKIPSVLVLGIFASWLIYEVQSIIYSSVFMLLASIKMANNIFLYSSIVSVLMLTGLSVLLASWLLLFIRYMAIATVSGRCRFMLALSYARELLRGKVWKNMFRIMPFVVSGFIVPAFMQAFAIAYSDNIPLSVALVFIGTVIEMVVFMLMWVYTVPEFFYQEKESGIQQKIQDMIARAMNMAKKQETEDNNNEENKKE